MYVSSWDRGRFMKNFRFNTICNITQELQELYRETIVPVGSSASLCDKISSIAVKSCIKGKSRFYQLATCDFLYLIYNTYIAWLNANLW